MGQTSRGYMAVLGLIVAAYLAVAGLYAVYTPLWQAPDEPAHYNYVRYLAENGHFPVLHMGDYPHEYLEEIKSRGFPAEMSIDSIRYESHQPPLYYAIAAGVYRIFAGAGLPARVLALRLLSALFGAGLLVTLATLIRTVFPRRSALALGTAAFVAFLPMHVAVTAAINNDTLAELILALNLLALARYLRDGSATGVPTSPRGLLGLGLLLGLALVTKSNIYIAVPLAGLAVLWVEGWQKRKLGGVLRAGALVLGLALLIAGPWYLRNSFTYGGLDLLGLGRHDQVVVGQLRTADFVAEQGLPALLQAGLRTTFQSFWGQFGWMGVVLDSRLYDLLRLFSLLAATGTAWAGWALWRRRVRLDAQEGRGLALLGLLLLFNLLAYLWYNRQFVQHQGCYLFPALAALGLLAAAGVWALSRRAGARWGARALLALMAVLLALGIAQGDLSLASLGIMGVLAAVCGARGLWLSDAWGPAIYTLPFVGLFILDLICLFGFIVPALA